MELPALTREQSRAIDRIAIEQYGMTGLVLMENAGRGCVDVLERIGIDGPIVILCGKGNNAGDGFVIARHLEIRGHGCRVLLLSPPTELRGDAAANFAILQKTNVAVIDVSERIGLLGTRPGEATPPPSTDSIQRALDQYAAGATWIIDALLGTGAIGAPRPPFDAAIEWINNQKARKLAVDVPSGLDCDTGEPSAHTIRADHTCTFAAMKIGYLESAAKPFIGNIHVCDIGVPCSQLMK
jgi:NAD(P)H-hydrate epimerase